MTSPHGRADSIVSDHGTIPDEPHLTSVDDVDAWYSNRLFMPPQFALTPDGNVWLIWISFKDEGMVFERLTSEPGAGSNVREPASFEEAFAILEGAYTVDPLLDRHDPLLAAVARRVRLDISQVAERWQNYADEAWTALGQCKPDTHTPQSPTT